MPLFQEDMLSKVNSAQEACAKCFVVHVSKFEIPQITWKNRKNHIKTLDLFMKNWKLWVWCSLLHFFVWFVRFQILICEPQSICLMLLVLSWLYHAELLIPHYSVVCTTVYGRLLHLSTACLHFWSSCNTCWWTAGKIMRKPNIVQHSMLRAFF